MLLISGASNGWESGLGLVVKDGILGLNQTCLNEYLEKRTAEKFQMKRTEILTKHNFLIG